MIDYEKRINVLVQVPTNVKAKHLNENYLNDYKRFVKMTKYNESILLPDANMHAELSSFQT